MLITKTPPLSVRLAINLLNHQALIDLVIVKVNSNKINTKHFNFNLIKRNLLKQIIITNKNNKTRTIKTIISANN